MFLLLSFIGILIGILISKYTKEELIPGKKYFLIIERICLLLIAVILVYNYKLSYTIIIGLILGYFLSIEYFFFSLVIIATNNLLISLIVFIYGLPYGSLIKTKKVLKEFILFIIPITLLLTNLNLTNEIVSLSVGYLFMRGVNWKFKT
ncbi:MAG: hypothetical protein PHF86_03795 [Candidatus Nanoarchaeia archaeon]|nr:hypothetical protein [Candidatus Nanoarchaeia archaeon]